MYKGWITCITGNPKWLKEIGIEFTSIPFKDKAGLVDIQVECTGEQLKKLEEKWGAYIWGLLGKGETQIKQNTDSSV